MLNGGLGSITAGGLTLWGLLLCTAASLVLGVAAACLFMYRNTYTKSFAVTLALLPAMVQIVIMLVNGNLGAGVAVMGAFSLVRFRSVPGSAREIGGIFFAMALGLCTGMGYLACAALFLAVVGGAMLLLSLSPFGEPRQGQRLLKITLPENMDYEGAFDDLFGTYTRRAQLLQVKTTGMGSLFEVHYAVEFKGAGISKEFIDALRCRNGNLNISCGHLQAGREEL